MLDELEAERFLPNETPKRTKNLAVIFGFEPVPFAPRPPFGALAAILNLTNTKEKKKGQAETKMMIKNKMKQEETKNKKQER